MNTGTSANVPRQPDVKATASKETIDAINAKLQRQAKEIDMLKKHILRDKDSDTADMVTCYGLQKEIEKLKADAARLQFMSSRQARICWNREGDLCDIWHIVDSRNEDSRWVRMVAGPFDSHQEAIDAAMKETK